jgi:hypothetical protein
MQPTRKNMGVNRSAVIASEAKQSMLGPIAAASIAIAMWEPVSFEVEPSITAGLDCFAALAMTAKSPKP